MQQIKPLVRKTTGGSSMNPKAKASAENRRVEVLHLQPSAAPAIIQVRRLDDARPGIQYSALND